MFEISGRGFKVVKALDEQTRDSRRLLRLVRIENMVGIDNSCQAKT